MSRILITGIAGLLGSHFSRHLLDRGHEVMGIDNLSGGYREFVDRRVAFRDFDLLDDIALGYAFASFEPQYVYHFAAYAAVGVSPFIRRFNYENNVVAYANVVNCCIKRDVSKLVFTSSMDVYGSAYAPPYTEDLIPMPEDPYGIAKYAVEQDLKQAGRLFGLKYSIVRPHNVFGTYQNIWDKYRNVLGIWIRQTLAGQPITVFGDGQQVRSFSHIKHYMDPFEKLMYLGDGQTYNIGAEEHVTILEAAQRVQSVARVLGYNPEIVHLEPRDEVKVAYCDHTKAKRDLGFRDETNLEQLVVDMFRWAEKQPKRGVHLMPYEIDKGMYSFWRS